MEKKTRLDFQSRRRIEQLLNQGHSVPEISKAIGFASITIFKELKKHSIEGTYSAKAAQRLSDLARKEGFLKRSKLTQPIFYEVKGMVAEGLSPTQITKRLNEAGFDVSRSTVYGWIDKGYFDYVPDSELNSYMIF